MTESFTDKFLGAALRTARGLRPCLSLLFSVLAVNGLAYTEIRVKYIIAQRSNGGEWSSLSSDWKQSDDSNSELTAIKDKNSIFYKNIPKEYEPLVATTNVSFAVPGKRQTQITETYNTGWVLVESGKEYLYWYKTFSITNSSYNSNTIAYADGSFAGNSKHQIVAYVVTILKSSGMPKNPSWLAGVDDGPESKVLVETQYPVSCAWLRKYFPSQSYWDLKDCAESIAPNGMPYYVAAMMLYDPADPNDRLGLTLEFEDGKPRPMVDIRSFRFQDYGFVIDVNCKMSLTDPEWTVCTEFSEAEVYNFFKAVIRNTKK